MSITEKAVCCTLSISGWSANKTDKKVTQKAIDDAHAKNKAGKFSKKLILSDVYDKYKNVESRARAYLEEPTFPFAGKMKILPVVQLDEVRDQMREFRYECEALRDEFIDGGDYEASVADAHNHLGSMFDPADYPDKEVVRSKFKFQFQIFPMPQAGHFVLDAEKEVVEEMQDELREYYDEVYKNCNMKLLNKIKKQVDHMYERLSGEEKHLKWTLTKNMREFVAMLPDLNINEDPEIDQFIADLRSDLCKFTVEDMRADQGKLSDTRKKAAAIKAKVDDHLNKMSAFLPTTQ